MSWSSNVCVPAAIMAILAIIPWRDSRHDMLASHATLPRGHRHILSSNYAHNTKTSPRLQFRREHNFIEICALGVHNKFTSNQITTPRRVPVFDFVESIIWLRFMLRGVNLHSNWIAVRSPPTGACPDNIKFVVGLVEIIIWVQFSPVQRRPNQREIETLTGPKSDPNLYKSSC